MRALFITTAVLALAACADNGEGEGDVSEEAAAIAENRPIEGPRSGENIEYDDQGRRWFYKPSTRTALFGTDDSEGVVSLSCNSAVTGEETLVFQWIEEARVDDKDTLSITSGDETASVEVKGIASVMGPASIWEGNVPQGSKAYDLLATGAGPFKLSLAGRSLTVPADQPLATAMQACLPG